MEREGEERSKRRKSSFLRRRNQEGIKQAERGEGVEEGSVEAGGEEAVVLSEQFDPARTCAHVLLPVVLLYWGVGGEIGL